MAFIVSSLLVLSYGNFREFLDKMCRCDGMVDVADSKSADGDIVWVRVPPPAPNTEAPVGCLCVWLNRTGLEAGGTKRSCGAFCPAGERKQSGRAARSASKGRFERRVPPPAPFSETLDPSAFEASGVSSFLP